MPVYDFRCKECGENNEMVQSIHEPLAPRVCLCGATMLLVMHPPALAGVGADSSRWRKKDAAFERDSAAYRRLRREGLQPTSIDGSAEIETRASESFEVTRDMVVESPKLRRRMAKVDSEMSAP